MARQEARPRTIGCDAENCAFNERAHLRRRTHPVDGKSARHGRDELLHLQAEGRF